ncbi:hypothetical protein J1C81_10580 [Streptococcus sanguinis]|jgi:hypothetical protein|uniref:Uncharacterized protein n=2 Tax=Streptococcus sanguinis TaxID=1305 RepID=F2CAZ9_STRSA|nr:hypothetical protein [Streptococcus sanguinis]RKV63989.1 MAG: hypothetical protein D8H99_70940 [Streptococcus sp.]EGF12356.1 hypothetical protein HMPREF9386_2365 [Streptococcus sanguinis SK330]EGF18437.1 hypothetical protein HMPREF9391_1745 [Streptococcus sanguinis SK408]EGF22578.1 hypothetical protein HMPREF9395_0314 [Streptococcus sanguinis SK1058]MCY7040009.1 hypothetical protein [Streptococcus sanguinis]
MADLQVLPVGQEVIGKTGLFVLPNFTERPATTYNDAYRDFEVSGDVQNGVRIRVYGLENSDIPKDKGMQKIESLTGLVMTVGSVRSRGKSKDEIVFEAKKMKLAK